jgi:hypothetical protein
MVGISMFLAIAICVFGAAGLFAWLSRPFSDLIPIVAPAATVAPAPEPTAPPNDEAPVIQQETAQDPDPAVEQSAEPTPTAATEDFAPTHQIGASQSVNFRAGPSTGEPIIIALSPATPLQFLGDEDSSQNGELWMRFRTEDGREGWVREIDTETFQP